MSSAKLKSPTSEAAGSADGRTKTLCRASYSASPGPRVGPNKASRKVPREAARKDPLRIRFSERLSIALGAPREVGITEARTQLPKMIRLCGEGQVFVIGNGNRADAPSAVLISVAALERAIREASKLVSSVTMGEIRASLPFSAMALEPLQAEPLPYDGLPEAEMPK